MTREHQNTEIFAIALQQHRYLGMIFIPYIIRLISEEGEIYTIVENIHESNPKKWDSVIPEGGYELLKNINEISDTTIHKQFSKGKTSASDFYKSLDKNEQVFQFVRAYLERRMIKCFDILCNIKTPVYLKEKNFNNLYEDHRLKLVEEHALPIFHFSVTETESRYRIDASCNGKSINLTTKESELICNDPCLLRVKNNLYRFSGIDGKKLSPFFTKQYISIPKSAERKYFETFVLNAIRNQIVEPDGFIIENNNPEKVALLSIEDRLAGGVGFTLKFIYGKKPYLANAKPEPEVILSIENDKYKFSRFVRDVDWEKGCSEKLAEFGLKKTGESEYLPTEITDEYNGQPPYQLVEWINKNQATIENAGFEIQQNHGKE